MTIYDSNRYWPFDSSEILDSEEIKFFKSFIQKEFEVFRFDLSNCGARSKDREGWIIVRGRRRWEIRLVNNKSLQLSAYLSDFSTANYAIESWLSGASCDEIIRDIHDALIVLPGAKASYTFY
jgi:hypothetical protein